MKRPVLLVATALVVAFLAFAGYQTFVTLTSLRDAKADAKLLKKQFLADDPSSAAATLDRIAAAGARAHAHSDNVVWDVAARLPWLGRNVESLQVMSRVVDATARTSLPSALKLFTVARSDDALRSNDGRFDLAAISALRPEFTRLAGRLETADDELATVEADRLFPALGDQALDFQDKLGTITDAAAVGAKATRLLPTMLGAQGKRTYLLVVQNNAEIRSTGGLPGSLSLLTVDRGKLSLGTQKTALNFDVQPRPVLRLTAEEKALFGPNMGQDIRDTDLTPDFPRAAELMSALMRQKYAVQVDGVLSVDPVSLAEVLKATGPIRVGRQQFTSANAVPILLNQTYQRYPTQAQQNAFFAAAAQGIFGALTNGSGNQKAVLRQVASAAGQRRLLVWSRTPAEERAISGTRVSGALPRDIGPAPAVGMYLSDGTASKIEYYLDFEGSLKSVSCTEDGVQTLEADLAMRSSVPDAVGRLSPWITGFGQYAPKGSMRMNLRIYAPTDGTISELRANGQKIKIVRLQHEGREVAIVGLLIDPGDELRVTATLTTRAGQRWDPELQTTPGIKNRPSVVKASTSCS